tara:strand:+ start:268 stop:480 length:213 start_codon:yes stop_codon:yes gene_type:complete
VGAKFAFVPKYINGTPDKFLFWLTGFTVLLLQQMHRIPQFSELTPNEGSDADGITSPSIETVPAAALSAR